jgi:oxygen-independent coproporphyrinogen III oxidase
MVAMADYVSEDLVEKYSLSGPYYTSYPSVGQWTKDYSSKDYSSHLDNLFSVDKNIPLSLYLHYPFCPELCTYCSCHVVISNDQDRMDHFLGYLFKEIDLLRSYFEKNNIVPNIREIHLGGGSPSVIGEEAFKQYVAKLQTLVDIKDLDQFAIEIDVRTVDRAKVEFYHDQGINRISFGVQDFNPDVQKAVNRIQPVEMIKDVLTPEVRNRFKSVNFDILWGLPLQTQETFRETVKTLKHLSPDRITLLHYGHFPNIFKHQANINASDIAGEYEKLMFNMEAIGELEAEGYEWVGLDHFAKPDNEMVQWKAQHRLRRGFIGYTCEVDNLIGLGPSALSSFDKYYAQNVYGLSDYYARLDEGVFPVFRGYEAPIDILIRRKVVNELIDYSMVNFEEIGEEFGIDFNAYFKRELGSMDELISNKLMELSKSSIKVTPLGRYFVRHICMVFDIFLQENAIHKPTSRKDSKLVGAKC